MIVIMHKQENCIKSFLHGQQQNMIVIMHKQENLYQKYLAWSAANYDCNNEQTGKFVSKVSCMFSSKI